MARVPAGAQEKGTPGEPFGGCCHDLLATGDGRIARAGPRSENGNPDWVTWILTIILVGPARMDQTLHWLCGRRPARE